MTRGKYAAKAANRLAQVDNEIITELRQKLARCEAERKALSQTLALERAQFNSEVLRVVNTKMQAEREQLAATLAAEHDSATRRMDEAADQVAVILGRIIEGLFERFGRNEGVLPMAALGTEGIAKVFRLLAPSRSGELLEVATGVVFEGDGLSRERKRRTASRLERDIRNNKARLAKEDLIIEASYGKTPTGRSPAPKGDALEKYT